VNEPARHGIRPIALASPPGKLLCLRACFRTIFEYMAHERGGVADVRFRSQVAQIGRLYRPKRLTSRYFTR
jgi:hypothetical protein